MSRAVAESPSAACGGREMEGGEDTSRSARAAAPCYLSPRQDSRFFPIRRLQRQREGWGASCDGWGLAAARAATTFLLIRNEGDFDLPEEKNVVYDISHNNSRVRSLL